LSHSHACSGSPRSRENVTSPGLLTGCEARPVTPNSSSSQPSRLVPFTSAVSRRGHLNAAKPASILDHAQHGQIGGRALRAGQREVTLEERPPRAGGGAGRPHVPLPYWSCDLLDVHIRKLDPSLTRFSAASTTRVGNPTWALEARGAALVPLATS
jgi:hypothetical protein